jgi:iron complex outermembrane receptor protein
VSFSFLVNSFSRLRNYQRWRCRSFAAKGKDMELIYSLLNRKNVASLLILLIASLAAHAQNGQLRGIVRTSDGKAAPHVFVQLKEIKKATISDEDGAYHLTNIPAGHYTIIVSFVGLQTINKPVVVTSDQTDHLDFNLVENETQLAEIVVFANRSMNERVATVGKLPIKPMDLPQAVVTIGETLMKNQQAQRLSDVVKNVNGVYLGTARASTQETFYARGYSFSSTNMFKNGSRVNSGSMPEVSSLESVEILKGGAAILYGNVAPGGILNMVTKKPKFNFGGEASFRAGSYNLFKPAIDVYGPLSNNIAYRVNGTFESADSYRDQVSSKRYYVNPSLLFKLGARTALIVEGDYLKHEFTPDFGIGSLDNTKVSDVPRSKFMGTPWQYNTTQQSTASATLNHSINSNWNFNTVLSYQHYERDYFAVERIQANAAGDWARPLGRVDTKENYVTGQLNLTGKFKTGKMEHMLLAGADADRNVTNTYNYDIQGKIYDTINLLDANKFVARTDIPGAARVTFVETPVNRFGAYVQDLISLTPKLKLLAGVRWSLQESKPARTTYLQKNDSLAKGKFTSANAFSPKLGLVYRMKPNVSFFASYSNSFSVNTGLDIYNNVLDPSIIDQYEVGVKNILLNGKLTVNLTGYKIVNNNLAQTAQFDANGNPNNNSNLKELTGQTTSNGIELDVTAYFLKGLSVIAGYSYNDMHYTKTPGTKGSYIEGERLVNTPSHTANGSVFYTFTHGPLERLKLGASVFYVGDRFGGWNNTVGQAQNYSRLMPVDGFTTVDISAGYSIKKFSLMAKLSNLGNAFNYYVHENYSINPIPPRQVIATVAYKF